MADTDTDDEQSCDCCSFRDPVGGVKEYTNDNPKRMGEKMMLCRICACTRAGNSHAYPEFHNAELLKTVAWIGNQLRRDIAEQLSIATMPPP